MHSLINDSELIRYAQVGLSNCMQAKVFGSDKLSSRFDDIDYIYMFF